jgi:hypothetical protein
MYARKQPLLLCVLCGYDLNLQSKENPEEEVLETVTVSVKKSPGNMSGNQLHGIFKSATCRKKDLHW